MYWLIDQVSENEASSEDEFDHKIDWEDYNDPEKYIGIYFILHSIIIKYVCFYIPLHKITTSTTLPL